MNRFCTFLGLRLFAVKENSSEINLQLFDRLSSKPFNDSIMNGHVTMMQLPDNLTLRKPRSFFTFPFLFLTFWFSLRHLAFRLRFRFLFFHVFYFSIFVSNFYTDLFRLTSQFCFDFSIFVFFFFHLLSVFVLAFKLYNENQNQNLIINKPKPKPKPTE